MDSIAEYLAISTSLIIVLFITILSFSNTVHRCILHSTQSNCCCKALNFLSPEL